MLRTDELTKDYGSFRALDRLSVAVAAGEVFGLLGPNGSGKSTALRLILGFLRPSAGSASIAGHDCWHDSVNARRHVSYLPGELRLYENMSGRQLVHFLTRLRNLHDSPELENLARSFEIDLSRPIANLSSGMKRKLALLQVLLPKAPLIILDEPTNTLDPTMRDELLEQLRTAGTRGQAVLFSSHVLSEVERVCNRVGILKNGKLAHLQEMNELKEARRVRAVLGQVASGVPDLPGVRAFKIDGPRVQMEYSGPLPPLLDWLARHEATDLQIEPLGLAGIYHRYHGNNA
jgi:ABC-2 type transport system ATP-binding protein